MSDVLESIEMKIEAYENAEADGVSLSGSISLPVEVAKEIVSQFKLLRNEVAISKKAIKGLLSIFNEENGWASIEFDGLKFGLSDDDYTKYTNAQSALSGKAAIESSSFMEVQPLVESDERVLHNSEFC